VELGRGAAAGYCRSTWRTATAATVPCVMPRASTNPAARGLPALPTTSPHTLRRTYISIALLANRFDVLWVMRQVGHADSHMTMDVYAQLQQRAERQHGEAFDGLVRQARERLYGAVEEAAGDDGEPDEEPPLEDLVDEWRDEREDS
jgi:hypothetical protein